MAEIKSLAERLGPAILPYERKKEQATELLPGECVDFSYRTEDRSNNGSPEFDLNLSSQECIDLAKLPEIKKFLWIIDEVDGSLRLRIIPEVTPNEERKHKRIVCHSNMTACGKALQGGECWWCEETKTMFINPKSGRYGAETVEQWEAVKEFFIQIGYSKLNDSISSTWVLKTI